MKIEEIKKGGTYYQKKTFTGKRTRRVDVTVLKYFVLEVNVEKKTVMASCNGSAVSEYKGMRYSRWVKDKPTEQ